MPMTASSARRRVLRSDTGTPYFRGFLQLLRRNVEGGGRHAIFSTPTIAIVVGMRGDLSDVWSYDTYYQYGRTNYAADLQNDSRSPACSARSTSIDNPATPGVDPICRSVRRRFRSELRALRHLRHRPGHAGGAQLSADPGLPARHHPADGRQRQRSPATSATTGARSRGRTTASASNFGVEYRKESLELQHRRSPSRTGRSRRPGRADARRSTAASTSARCSAKSACRSSSDSFFYELSLERRLSLLVTTVGSGREHQHRHLQDRPSSSRRSGTSASAPLQPRGPRAEHPGAVRAAVASLSTARPIRAPATPITAVGIRLLMRAGPYGRPVGHRRPTRPASITACSAATRTAEPGNRRPRSRSASSSSRASSRGSR